MILPVLRVVGLFMTRVFIERQSHISLLLAVDLHRRSSISIYLQLFSVRLVMSVSPKSGLREAGGETMVE